MISTLHGIYLTVDDAAELVTFLEAAARVARPNARVDHIARHLRRTVDKLTSAQGNSAPNLSPSKYGVQFQPGSAQHDGHDDHLVDTSEAAKLLGVTPAGVRYLADNGRLDAQRIAGRWVLRRDVVMARAHQQAARRAG
jgi:hypothetical protein